jgi:hypothetical protein
MEFKLPTETIELPSKGLVYPEGHPLSSGTIELKYMTAKEEDILTNTALIQNGTVLDKLLESLIITKVNFSDLLIGDKNAILVAARILGYGKDYTFKYLGQDYTVDLSLLEPKPLDESLYTRGQNEFEFTLPSTGTKITFKLLTHGDELKISQEVESLKKLNKNTSPDLSTRLKHMILSVEDSYERKDIREFVDNYFLARDSKAFREHIRNLQPDLDLTFFPERSETRVDIPIGIGFFWPELR